MNIVIWCVYTLYDSLAMYLEIHGWADFFEYFVEKSNVLYTNKKKILLQVCFPHHSLQTWAQPFRDE